MFYTIILICNLIFVFLYYFYFNYFFSAFKVIVEEAAEVLEAHIVASLKKSCQHLILIGEPTSVEIVMLSNSKSV